MIITTPGKSTEDYSVHRKMNSIQLSFLVTFLSSRLHLSRVVFRVLLGSTMKCIFTYIHSTKKIKKEKAIFYTPKGALAIFEKI